MHPDLANLACTFVCRTTSLHVTHLHEVVRAQSPIACLGDNTKNTTLFLLNFSSGEQGQTEWHDYTRLLGWFFSLIISLLVSSDLTLQNRMCGTYWSLILKAIFPNTRSLLVRLLLFLSVFVNRFIQLMNFGAPRSAIYILHDCPELSTGKYWQIEIEGIMSSRFENWNPPHYNSNM